MDKWLALQEAGLPTRTSEDVRTFVDLVINQDRYGLAQDPDAHYVCGILASHQLLPLTAFHLLTGYLCCEEMAGKSRQESSAEAEVTWIGPIELPGRLDLRYQHALMHWFSSIETLGLTPAEVRIELRKFARERGLDEQRFIDALLARSRGLPGAGKLNAVASLDQQSGAGDSALGKTQGGGFIAAAAIAVTAIAIAGLFVLSKYVLPLQASAPFQLLSSELLLGIGVAWFALLILTWMIGGHSAKSCGLLDPARSSVQLLDGQMFLGRIVAFKEDYFYHLFQFFWLPFFGISAAIIALTASTLAGPSHIFTDAQLATYLSEIDRISISSIADAGSLTDVAKAVVFDLSVVTVISVLFGVFGAANQVWKQNHIKNDSEFVFWWHRRVNKRFWLIRVIMVGVDIGLAVLLVSQLIAVLLILWDISGGAMTPAVNVIALDRAGGLKELFDIRNWFIAASLVTGLFLISSFYLHRRQAGYLWIDLLAIAVFTTLAICTVVVPTMRLEALYQAEYEALLATTGALELVRNAPALAPLELTDLVRQRDALVALGRPDEFGVITSGGLLLLLEVLIMLFQLVQREQGGEANSRAG